MLTQTARILERHTTELTDKGTVASVYVGVRLQRLLTGEGLATVHTGERSHLHVSELVRVEALAVVETFPTSVTEITMRRMDLFMLVQILVSLETFPALVALKVVAVHMDRQLVAL